MRRKPLAKPRPLPSRFWLMPQDRTFAIMQQHGRYGLAAAPGGSAASLHHSDGAAIMDGPFLPFIVSDCAAVPLHRTGHSLHSRDFCVARGMNCGQSRGSFKPTQCPLYSDQMSISKLTLVRSIVTKVLNFLIVSFEKKSRCVRASYSDISCTRMINTKSASPVT